MATLAEVEEKIMKIKAPTGEPDAPAMSCHDFKVHNEENAKKGGGSFSYITYGILVMSR